MNKSELIDAIADSSELTKTDAGRALDGFIDAVTGALKNGDSVALVGFGTFQVKERAARKGRNPQTHDRSVHSQQARSQGRDKSSRRDDDHDLGRKPVTGIYCGGQGHRQK